MAETPPLQAIDIRAGYGHGDVLKGVDLRVGGGKITTIIGPNGCGKSTLLKVLSRLLRPTAGSVLLSGSPLEQLRTREIARSLAVLPQLPVAPDGMTVAELVRRGRQPHQPWYRQWSEQDERITADAMRDTQVAELADTAVDRLSGGQRQRAWIAMSLAQQTELLLLDEPTTHLDMAHAVDVLELVTTLRDVTGRTIVVVLHDLGLAARYSDDLVVMKAGSIVAQGPPAEVLSEELLLEVFGLRAHLFDDPFDGLPTVIPVRRTGIGGAAPAGDGRGPLDVRDRSATWS
ncbi:ABC transporter ATP-binding protein [Nakamurella lactea]|uniref:ABC transporter ATP-binding protein n=1 Tax=Nakamurella lactea TaxID=459515 RepID=UPI00040D58F7|nr:ABC transporter ATP-binding protein [Nakamurella lactea]